MKKLILFLVLLSATAFGQWRDSSGTLVPTRKGVPVKVQRITATNGIVTSETADTMTVNHSFTQPKLRPARKLIVVPQEPYAQNASVGYSPPDSASVYVYGFYIDSPTKIIGAGIVGNAVGTASYRTFTIGIYDSSQTLLSQTITANHPGAGSPSIPGFRKGTGGSGVQDTVSLPPGQYWAAFNFYTNQNAHYFKGPDISTNTFGVVFITAEMDGNNVLWTGRCNNVARSNGAGVVTLPSTLGGVVRPTTTVPFPWVVLIPLGIGPATQ